jgi:hypothetical protein
MILLGGAPSWPLVSMLFAAIPGKVAHYPFYYSGCL